jgi:hypothetical protein
MVSNANQNTLDSPVNQWVGADIPWPNQIGASTPYDFEARRVPQVRGPHGQVFVRGVEIPRLGPGKPRTSIIPRSGNNPTATPDRRSACR